MQVKWYTVSAIILGCLMACQSAVEMKPKAEGKYISLFNKKIYYETHGQGTPLILLSGGGLVRSIHDFDKCVPALAEHFQVIVPDAPGQGKSEQADTLTYDLLKQFASRFIDSLHVDSCYVLGWSDGGITGILLAESRPDKVKKVIAVGANNGLRRALPPGIPVDSVYPMTIDYYEKANADIIEQYSRLEPKKDWKKYMQSANAMVYQKENYFPDSVYTRITIPVMIVLGDRDDIVVEHGLDMHRQIKGSQLCIMPNTSHDVFSEKPELISAIAIDFISKPGKNN